MIKTRPLKLLYENGEEPESHLRKEVYVGDYNRFSYRGYGEAKEEPYTLKSKSKIYPVCWGWNADGRAGNATAVELRTPHIAHKSAMRNYISSASGSHHSLLVCDKGMVYSFGNGRKGQLGYSNEFMVQAGAVGPKGGIQQTCPRRVTPSGNLLFGADLRIAEVAAGRFFSLARQLSPDEGIESVEGLKDSVRALTELRDMYPDSLAMQLAWAQVRQEKFKILRTSTGQLLTWGTGPYGELGHNEYTLYYPKPKLIDRLRSVCITQVSVGRHHALAISSTAELFTWGSGKRGKLGHGNFVDYHKPEYVQFFEKYYVEYCSAGDNHSVVLTRTRKGDREKQLKRVAAFGKGAHGRLGYGRNLVKSLPVLVDTWPGSLEGMQIHSVSAGGAHTLALLYKPVPKSLANPWGRETAVAAWGFGANGQLGTGYTVDSFVPIRVRMPERCLLIREVCAGRSWSMARSIGGELFTWGRGLRGQLGHGKPKFKLVPTKVKTFGSFVRMSAGFGHNACLTVPKKVLNRKSSDAASHYDDPFDAPQVDLSIDKRDSESAFQFNCCRRTMHPIRRRLRYMCKECNIDCCCFGCMKICHAGHTIIERLPVERETQKANAIKLSKKRKPQIKGDTAFQKARQLQRRIQKASSGKRKKKKKTKALINIKTKISSKEYRSNLRKMEKTKIPFCRCGVYNDFCNMLPSIIEEEKELCDSEGDISYPERQKDRKLGDLPLVLRRHQAAIRIQRQAQWYIGRRNIKKIRANLIDLRRVVCKQYFDAKIMGPIWDKLERSRSRFRESREQVEMATEESSKKCYDYFYAMQIGISACNAINYAGQRFVGGLSVSVPRVLQGSVATEPKDILTTNCFSWASIRHQQLQLHPSKRVSPALLAELTKHIPRESVHEGVFPDVDLECFTRRFTKDIETEIWRKQVKDAIETKENSRKKALEAARAILIQQKFGAQRAVEEALAKKGPQPPKIPPSPAIIAAQRLDERRKELQELEAKFEAAVEKERKDFDMYEAPKDDHNRTRRRHSLGFPDKMYQRLSNLQKAVPLQGSSRRRNSVPAKMLTLHVEEKPNYPSFAESKKSLEFYGLRKRMMEEWVLPEHAPVWRNMEDRMKNKRLKKLLSQSWLNPRLPMEMRQMLRGSTRRRSIADPERLAEQLHLQFGLRNMFAQGRAKAAEVDKLRFRRRSFDLGEIKDDDDGIIKVLGYVFEEAYKQPTLSDIRRDSALMENRMIFAGLIKKKGKDKRARPDFGGFAAKETVQQRIERELQEKDNKEQQEAALAGGGGSRLEQAKAAAGNMPKLGKIKAGGGGGGGGGAKAPRAKTVPQADIWREYFADTGETYYYNDSTGESVWDFPDGDSQVLSQYQDDDGNYYWYNWTTGETQWA